MYNCGGVTVNDISFRSIRMKRQVACMVGAAVALFSTSAVLGETLDAVAKAITEKAESHKSQQARVITTQKMQTPQMKLDSQSDTTYECLKKGDKWLYRSESKTKSDSVVAGQENKQEGTSLVIYDGEYVWTLSEMNGQKMAVKNRPAADFSQMPNKAFFDSLEKSYELKVLPDETVDGKATWVIQATPREAPPEGLPAVLIMYFDKDTGISLKTLGKDSSGKEVLTVVTKDVKTDAPLAADRFVFKVPEGVQLMDMTQNEPGQPQAEPSAAQPEEPKQPEQPKKEEPKKKKGLKLPKLP
jgi:outer membrane lipoprotein-sorting protein